MLFVQHEFYTIKIVCFETRRFIIYYNMYVYALTAKVCLMRG